MVGVVQWLERQIVALDVVGSNPTTHPTFPLVGVSPSGKARDFDSRIRRFKSCYPSQQSPQGRYKKIDIQ